MSTENPNRFEDKSSNPDAPEAGVAEAVVTDAAAEEDAPDEADVPQEVAPDVATPETVTPEVIALDAATPETVALDDELEVPLPAPALGPEDAGTDAEPGDEAGSEPSGEAASEPDLEPDTEPAPVPRRSILADPEPTETAVPEQPVFPDEPVVTGTSPAQPVFDDEPPTEQATAEQVIAEAAATETAATGMVTAETNAVGGTVPVQVSEEAPSAGTATGQDTEQDEVLAAPPSERLPRTVPPRTEDDILLEGSTVVGKPAPRTASHWAGVLLAVVLLPFAWFFLHDSAAQVMTSVDANRFGPGVGALVELAIGAGALALALWAARRSSLGTIVVGVLTLLVGLPALVAPALMNQHLGPVLDRLAQQSSLGEDLASYVWADAATGRFAWLGLLLLMVGVVSHSARRAGRREQEVIDRVRKPLD